MASAYDFKDASAAFLGPLRNFPLQGFGEMVTIGWIEPQVLQAIIGRIIVHVMHDFGACQISADGRFHYEAMFSDVPRSVGVWMPMLQDEHIPLTVLRSPPLPIAVAISRARASLGYRQAMSMTEASDLFTLDRQLERGAYLWAVVSSLSQLADLGQERKQAIRRWHPLILSLQ